ncbi:MAG: CDP-diacylglycerol--glycerol-3-phosphate 3-phosphatidyltransferase [Elusimicrobiota bacterium]
MSGLPNQMTLSRVFLAPVFAFCVLERDAVSLGLASLTVVAAFTSDLLDGYLARRFNLVSQFGICFDPVADKIFMLSAFSALVAGRYFELPVFPLILIIIREILISGLRVILLVSGESLLPAQRLGKIKSCLQFGFIFIMSVAMWLGSLGLNVDLPFGLLFWAVGIFTVASGVPYFWRHRPALARSWTQR